MELGQYYFNIWKKGDKYSSGPCPMLQRTHLQNQHLTISPLLWYTFIIPYHQMQVITISQQTPTTHKKKKSSNQHTPFRFFSQYCNISAEAMMGWFRYPMFMGLKKVLLLVASTKLVLPKPAFRTSMISFRDSSLWLSSPTWALSTEFSASTLKNCCVVMLTLVSICWFSFLSWATWVTRSSKCFCFLMRDRRADSRFDIILFLFLWSITARKSSSEPEFWSKEEDPEHVPLEEAMLCDTRQEHNTIQPFSIN